MMSRKECCMVLVMFLATLVFAGSRTGKNTLIVEDVAWDNSQPVVVKDVAVLIAQPCCEWMELSTNMVGNVSFEDLEPIVEGNVEYYSNVSNVANAAIANWNENVLQTFALLGSIGVHRMYGFNTYGEYYAYRMNRFSWYGFESSFAAELERLSGGKGFNREYRANALNGSHARFMAFGDEREFSDMVLGWNSTRSFRRRRRSDAHVKSYSTKFTIDRTQNVIMVRTPMQDSAMRGSTHVSPHVVIKPMCNSLVAVVHPEESRAAYGCKQFLAPRVYKPSPIPPLPEVVALESLWFAMQEFLADKNSGTFMSVWQCQSRIPDRALLLLARTFITFVVYTIYESIMYLSRVVFVVTVGSASALLWLGLHLLMKVMVALAAVVAMIVSQRPWWVDAVIEADVFNTITMHRLRVNLLRAIRLFTKALGQFVLSRSLRHIARRLLFPNCEGLDVIPSSFALAGIAAMLRAVLIDSITKERRSLVKRRNEKAFQPFATMFFWLIVMLSLTAVGAAPCQTCFSAECAGADKCPLLETTLTNTGIMMGTITTGVITCLDLLPLKFILVLTNATLNSLMAVAKRGVIGTQVDLTTLDVPEFIQRITTGAVSVSDGLAEVLRRQAVTGVKSQELAQLTSIQSTLLAMNSQGWGIAQASATETRTRVFGAYSFVMGLAARIALNENGRSATAGVVDSNVTTERMGVVTSALVRPKSNNQLSEFLLNWIMIVHATGLANALVAGAFVREVVYEGMSITGLSWQVAHELFLVYLFEVERGIHRGVSLCNVFAQGSQDTNVRTATRNALLEYGEGADKPSNAASVKEKIRGDTVTWNGKSTSSAQKCCKVYNAGPGATHAKSDLTAEGKCKHKHGCDKWVTNNGKFGRCESTTHTRQNCNNSNACDDPVST